MESLSANAAKTHFGELLLKVQREPVQINKNGKAVAVVLPVDDYASLETLKMNALKNRIKQVKEDIMANRTTNGDHFFDDLFNGTFDYVTNPNYPIGSTKLV